MDILEVFSASHLTSHGAKICAMSPRKSRSPFAEKSASETVGFLGRGSPNRWEAPLSSGGSEMENRWIIDGGWVMASGII